MARLAATREVFIRGNATNSKPPPSKKVKVIVEFYLSSTQELLSIFMSVRNVSFTLQITMEEFFGRVQAAMFAQHVAKLICVVKDQHSRGPQMIQNPSDGNKDGSLD